MFDIRKKLTPKNAKWILNLYPPFLFNRIRIQSISADFTKVNVKIKKSIWNKNLAGTIFGGTLFSAADPFIAVMYWQIFSIRFHKNIIVWLKGAEIQYKIPSNSDMSLHFKIDEEEILLAKKDLDEKGKHVATYKVDLINTSGEICAVVKLHSYLGNPK